ncbi:MAG TPA: bifunctional phosphopantothenoylcysteine decarboxylase/phosphopantothenate--cysteine ligase CoaBC [Anaerolineae bacterium]|nr:bifunctional phosphopantothenoylcysteine decarboxylase/phosphopantothenate--cysteine ligase CoaBC [Anaerolineae bacterium]
MANPLISKHILLGVTGSIAAYKAAELASKLYQSDVEVYVMLTEAAQKFISPLTFQTVTDKKAYTESDLWGREGHVVHVHIGRQAELMIIAPATANTIAKLAYGIADNLLTLTTLAVNCPILIAPAMDVGMYSHSATQENISVLEKRGVQFIGPLEGHLASGLEGIGRMVEPSVILQQARWMLAQDGLLKGKKIVITAGGTQESIDPVRILTNRSSGKQGYAVAQAALDAGAQVMLINPSSHLIPPTGAKTIRADTAADMYHAVLNEINDADALIMAAAVSDFRPKKMKSQKIKKENGYNQIQLEQTEDILVKAAEVKQKSNPKLILVGFAAESQDLIANARKKMKAKHLDLMAVNDITQPDAGFASDTNRITLLFANGKSESLPLMPKIEVAEKIIAYLIEALINK